MKSSDNKKLLMADLFTGIGGIRLGFKKAFKNIDTVFSCEIDKNACLTYQKNFKDNPLGDITEIDEKELPDFNILAAGFPCQAFSQAGKRKGFDEARGTLFFDVARIIDHKKPEVVFLENVKGLVSHDRGNTFKVIINTLQELGYFVYYQVLNAKDYGLPQKRERIYIVAFNKEKVKDYKGFKFPEKLNKKVSIERILDKNVELKYFVSQQYFNTLLAHKKRHSNKGNGFGFEVISPDSIANTIVVGGMGRERNLVVDKSKPTNKLNKIKKINKKNIRTMTPREWARLQGFPESFKFPVSDTQIYKQLGNSVAVNVIEAVAKEIKKFLEKENK